MRVKKPALLQSSNDIYFFPSSFKRTFQKNSCAQSLGKSLQTTFFPVLKMSLWKKNVDKRTIWNTQMVSKDNILKHKLKHLGYFVFKSIDGSQMDRIEQNNSN